MDRSDPGKDEALARAHEMRAMRHQGLSDELIAAFFNYAPSSVRSIVAWHQSLFPEMPPYEGDTVAWREFTGRYLRGRL